MGFILGSGHRLSSPPINLSFRPTLMGPLPIPKLLFVNTSCNSIYNM